MGTDAIPQGQTPGDLPVSEEELKALEANSTMASQGVGVGGAAAGIAPAAHTSADLKHAQSSPFADSASTVGAAPPAYDEGFDAPPPPAAIQSYASQPRDAAAEKEALRRQYAQQDLAATSGASIAGGSAVDSSTAAPQHASAGGAANTHPSKVEATFDFAGSEDGDLSFSAGQVINVDGMEGDQWYRGSYTTQDGKLKTGSEFSD